MGQDTAKTYKIIVDNDTKFVGRFLPKPVYLQATPSQPTSFNLADLKVGDEYYHTNI